jgi:hypothetical protein
MATSTAPETFKAECLHASGGVRGGMQHGGKCLATTVPPEAVKAENLDASEGVRGGMQHGMAEMHGIRYST